MRLQAEIGVLRSYLILFPLLRWLPFQRQPLRLGDLCARGNGDKEMQTGYFLWRILSINPGRGPTFSPARPGSAKTLPFARGLARADAFDQIAADIQYHQ